MTQHKSVRRYNDQYFCDKCGKQWDVNENEPDECVVYTPPINHIKGLRELLKSKQRKD